jgi:Domain of unknown function (DUF4149)
MINRPMMTNSLVSHRSISTLFNPQLMLNNKVLSFVLALWLGGSLVLDLLVMPTLYRTGMMSTASFASAGEALFLAFNSGEIIMAAIVLVAILARRQDRDWEAHLSLGGLGLPLGLCAIALLYRYGLTPQMGGLGIQLDWLTPATMPSAMLWLHASYWLLESLKLASCGILLNRCFRSAL